MRRSRLAALALLLALPLASAGAERSEAYSGARARRGMVASSDAIASRVGADILRKGGNAVDAAVAVALVLAVTWPAAGNLGGGGFMLIRLADGRATAIDYRETAPAKAERDMYFEGHGAPDASTLGWRAIAVPGTVAGLALAHERYGTMRWKDLVEPARKLAAEGFLLTHAHASSLEKKRGKLGRFPESKRIFLRDGKLWGEGELFKQPDLAATLERLAQNGLKEFTVGETARRLVADMAANGGLITQDDLLHYDAIERPVVRGTYRGYEVISMPPPSSGGTVLIEMLQALEHFDVRGTGYGSSGAAHLLVETMRRAFADRAALFGDPDFVRVPVERLLSKEYAAKLARSIDLEHATPSAEVRAGFPVPEALHTTHFTVVDGKGNAVANTYTLNGSYGSGVTAKGTGFLLNNEMDDFTSRPGAPNQFGLVQGEANAIAPGKRPLSSMTPTILLKDGRLFMALGSQGGPTIITQVLQVILNVIDHGMNLQQAVDAPRIHHQWQPDVIYSQPYGMPADVREALRAKGHARIETYPDLPYMGDVEAVMVEPESGMLLGASDSRNPNARAVGE